MNESGETERDISESKPKDPDSSATRPYKPNFLRRALSTAARKFGTTGPGINPFADYGDIFLPKKESPSNHLNEPTEDNKPNEKKENQS